MLKGITNTMGVSSYNCNEPSIITLRADDDLVRAAKLGDNEAFAELCRRHAHTARRRIVTIVRHQEDAEDAMQETLLSAYANLTRFRQSCKFSTWITAIGINAALIVIRKRRSRRESDIRPCIADEPDWDVVDREPDPFKRNFMASHRK